MLLPIAAFYLKLGRFAPARMLIDRGVPVALGTDINPGGGFSPSMPFAMTLACFAMGMTLEEALVAATLNAAWSLDRADTVGSLEPGKLMDAVVIDGDLADLVACRAIADPMVIKRGKVIVRYNELRRSVTAAHDMALADLLDAFASNEPVPGGGSAAALAGAVGVSLLMMVAGLPKTRTGAPEEAADLAEASARLRPLRDTLASLVEQRQRRVRGGPRGDAAAEGDRCRQSGRAARPSRRRCAGRPRCRWRRCALPAGAARRGHRRQQRQPQRRNRHRDGGVELLLAGLRGAALNVDVNLKSMLGCRVRERVTAERDQLDGRRRRRGYRLRRRLRR